jgi:hypothetical protein
VVTLISDQQAKEIDTVFFLVVFFLADLSYVGFVLGNTILVKLNLWELDSI